MQQVCCEGPIQELEVAGKQIRPVTRVKALGQCVTEWLPPQGGFVMAKRTQGFLQRVRNIEALRLPHRLARKMLQVMAFPVLDYCPWQIDPHRLGPNLRLSVARALFGGVTQGAASEILLGTLVPGHTLDPVATLTYRLVLALGEGEAIASWPTLPARFGPRILLAECMRHWGFRVLERGRVLIPEIGTIRIRAPGDEDARQKWRHNWREVIRRGNKEATTYFWNKARCPIWKAHFVAGF